MEDDNTTEMEQFFLAIPETCQRIREEREESEWTDHEWTTLRDVSQEYLRMEIFLTEARHVCGPAEAQPSAAVVGASGFSLSAFHQVGLPENYKDLEEKVQEIGDEIRMSILSGMAMTFDMALKSDLQSIVALVETVTAFEDAHAKYKAIHGTGKTLRFTNMKDHAIREVYQDQQARFAQVFETLLSKV